MPGRRLVLQHTTLEDVTFARQLGHRVSTENLQLDFEQVEQVTAEFARVLCQIIVAPGPVLPPPECGRRKGAGRPQRRRGDGHRLRARAWRSWGGE